MANSPGARLSNQSNQLVMTLIVVGCCAVAVLPAVIMSALRAGAGEKSALFDVRMLLGGALLQFIGLGGAFLLGAALYAAAMLALLRPGLPEAPAGAPRERVWRSIIGGMHYVRTQRLTMGVLRLAAV